MTAGMQDAVAYTQSRRDAAPTTEGSLPENLEDIFRAIKDLSAMQAQFFLCCDDIRSVCLTSQHTCDMMGNNFKML